jgi:ankyrin repeat protein
MSHVLNPFFPRIRRQRIRSGYALIWILVSVSVLAWGGILLAGANDSPVARAAKSGDLAAVRKLIAAKADVNLADGDGSTALLWAAYESDLEMTKALLTAGAKPNTANHYGVTPLLQASRNGDAATIDALLKGGADASLAHPEGETPLMAASKSGHVDAVNLLLARKVNVNAADKYQEQTALMWAASEGHVDVVSALLAAGADPNKKAHVNSLTDRKNADHPTGGFTALMWAARNGEEETVKRLVKGGADMTLKNGDGATATVIAIYNDRFDMAATLVNLGSDVNDGSLYTAVEMRDSTTDQFAFDGSRLRPNHTNKMSALDLIGFLLERGADPYKVFTGQFHSTSMPNSDRFDNSAYFRSAVQADAEALKVFAAHMKDLDKVPEGAPPLPENPDGPPAVAAGPRGGRGGNPNAGRTATLLTMTGGRGPQMTGGPGYIRDGAVPYREPGSRKPVDAFAVLLKAGANPNAKGPDGSTLLHQAAQARNLDMIKLLADAHVNFNATNKDGLTALDVAEGKQPANAPAAPARGGGAPPAVGGPARGGRGGPAGPTTQDVAKLLRELMGLPPALPPANAANGATAPAAPAGGNQ